MQITVTGATGKLGRLVVEELLADGVPPADVVATGRAIGRLADLAARGVDVRRADFDDPGSLDAAFEGSDRILLISGSELGKRVPQHQAAISAAAASGAGLVAYTSITHADTSQMILAREHLATEQALTRSGVPYSLLRNSWYLENYVGQVPTALQFGVVLGCAGEGRVSAALRVEFAQAAAAVLTGEGHEGSTYELGGVGFTLAEFAAAIASASGQEVAYRELSPEDLAAALEAAGLAPGYAAVLADSDLGIARGDLYTDTGDLGRLIRRQPTTMAEAVAAEVLAQG
jgi:NAD(P)H dehydrogenase (quinone)